MILTTSSKVLVVYWIALGGIHDADLAEQVKMVFATLILAKARSRDCTLWLGCAFLPPVWGHHLPLVSGAVPCDAPEQTCAAPACPSSLLPAAPAAADEDECTSR